MRRSLDGPPRPTRDSGTISGNSLPVGNASAFVRVVEICVGKTLCRALLGQHPLSQAGDEFQALASPLYVEYDVHSVSLETGREHRKRTYVMVTKVVTPTTVRVVVLRGEGEW